MFQYGATVEKCFYEIIPKPVFRKYFGDINFLLGLFLEISRTIFIFLKVVAYSFLTARELICKMLNGASSHSRESREIT